MTELNETLYLIRLFIIVELSLTGITVFGFVWWFLRRNWKRIKMRTIGKSKVDLLFDGVFETIDEQRQRLNTVEEHVLRLMKKPKK